MEILDYVQDPLVCIKIKRRLGPAKRIYLEMGGWYVIPDSKAAIYINSILMQNNMIQSIRINATLYNGGQKPMKDNYTYKQFLAVIGYDLNRASIDKDHCEFNKFALATRDQYSSVVIYREGYSIFVSLTSPKSQETEVSEFQSDLTPYEIMYIGDDIPEYTIPEDCFGIILGDGDNARYKLAISRKGLLQSYNDKIPYNSPKINFTLISE